MVNRIIKVLLITTVLSIIGSMPVQAHHSTQAFYTDEEIIIDAEVVEWSYKNPHAVLVFKDKEGEHWVGEMGNIFSMSRQGVTPDSVPVGAQVEIKAKKAREPVNRVHIEAIMRDGKAIYGTPDR